MKTQSHVIFRANLRALLNRIGISAYRIAVATGHNPSWLTGLMNEKRTSHMVSSAAIDDVGDTLGVPPHELINPDFDPSKYECPKCLEEKKEKVKS